MSIPSNISKNHILQALAEIDRDGVPSGKGSTKFTLIDQGKPYPPKHVIRVANKFANGRELSTNGFSGGQESNGFLARLGFEIVGGTTRQV